MSAPTTVIVNVFGHAPRHPHGLGLRPVVFHGKRRMQTMKVNPIELVDVEKVLLSIAPKDEDGRPVGAGQAEWAVADESVVTLEVQADTLSAYAISGAPGVTTVTATCLGMSDEIDVTVKVGAPVSLNLSAGVPVHE